MGSSLSLKYMYSNAEMMQSASVVVLCESFNVCLLRGKAERTHTDESFHRNENIRGKITHFLVILSEMTKNHTDKNVSY